MRSEPAPVPMWDQLAPPSVLDQRPPFGLMLPPLATATMISSLPGTWHMLLRLPHGAWVGSPAKLFVTLIHLPLDGLPLGASGAGAPPSEVPLASSSARSARRIRMRQVMLQDRSWCPYLRARRLDRSRLRCERVRRNRSGKRPEVRPPNASYASRQLHPPHARAPLRSVDNPILRIEHHVVRPILVRGRSEVLPMGGLRRRRDIVDG